MEEDVCLKAEPEISLAEAMAVSLNALTADHPEILTGLSLRVPTTIETLREGVMGGEDAEGLFTTPLGIFNKLLGDACGMFVAPQYTPNPAGPAVFRRFIAMQKPILTVTVVDTPPAAGDTVVEDCSPGDCDPDFAIPVEDNVVQLPLAEDTTGENQ